MNGLLNSPLDRTISAIIGIESGGRWDALGPVIDNPNSRYFGDRAYGVSQVMGRNIPEWTSRYLGRTMTPAEYLADPEAQMGVTRGVIGDWLGRGYSPQEAANLWFTGSANPNPNVSDNLGTSASDYQRRFNERFNQPSAMPAGFQQQFDQFFGQRGGQDMGGVMSGMSQPAEPQRGGMFRQPEFWENLALAANTLRLEPDQGLAQQIASQREARAAQQGVNRTVEFFQSRGMDELAQLAQIDPVSAMRQYVQMSQPVQAEPIRGVEVGGNLVNPITGEVIYGGGAEAGATQVTGAQLMERFGVQNLDPNALFNISPDGKITPVSPGPTTVVSYGGEKRVSPIEEEGAKLMAKQFAEVVDQGAMAGRSLGTLQALENALQESPQGFAGVLIRTVGEFGIPMEGLDAVQATQALINQLVPAQRPPGSGSMSDTDVAMFKQSLPRLINQPGGNKRILDTMRAIVEYDQQRGIIAQNVLLGRITPEQAFEQYNALANPLAWVRTFGGGDQPVTAAPSGAQVGGTPDFSTWTDEQLREFIRERGGNP